MFMIPLQVDDTSYELFFVIGEENLNRMKKYDPVTRSLADIPYPFNKMKCSRLIICYADDLEMKKLENLAKSSDLRGILDSLLRGFKFDPSTGDGEDIRIIRKWGDNVSSN